MEIKFEIDDSEYENLQLICKLTNKDIADFAYDAVHKELLPYCSPASEKITPANVIWVESHPGADGKMKAVKTPCVCIGKTSVFGKPYYKIIRDGQMYKVPAEMVRLNE